MNLTFNNILYWNQYIFFYKDINNSIQKSSNQERTISRFWAIGSQENTTGQGFPSDRKRSIYLSFLQMACHRNFEYWWEQHCYHISGLLLLSLNVSRCDSFKTFFFLIAYFYLFYFVHSISSKYRVLKILCFESISFMFKDLDGKNYLLPLSDVYLLAGQYSFSKLAKYSYW